MFGGFLLADLLAPHAGFADSYSYGARDFGGGDFGGGDFGGGDFGDGGFL
jgi:hypothetical protein